jgi:protocatechuate 3,4-dioxygenase beta subunit
MIQEIRPISAPARDVVIDLPAGGRITGRVVDKATRRPISAFQAGVSTSRGGGGMMVMTPPMLRGFTSEDGSFTLENVKPGPTQVVAMAPGYTTGRAPNVEVEDGKAITDVEVALESGAKLVGKVTDSSGVPLAGVSVRADMGGPGGSRVMRFDVGETTTITDPNGEYTLDSLEPGEKTFNFNRSGYVSESKTVTLASGKDTRADVTLGSGLRVGGVVVTEGGAPVAEATVRASSAAGGGREAHTDAGGAFQLEGLAPGHYTFNASKAGMANGITRDVDIATMNNVRIVMKSGGTITGHITGLTTQELSQTNVMAQSPNGNASAPVDSAGNFRLEGAPTGTVRVIARTGQMFGGKNAPPKTVELEPGGSAQVDIDFKSETVIRGRVTHNGQPVPRANVNFIPRQGKAQTNASSTADDSGNYEVNGLEDGPYNVQAVDMQKMVPFTTTYDVHGSGNFDIDVRTASVRGRVIDGASGQPINEAQIDIRPRGSDMGFFGSRSAVTDSNGSFVVDSVSRGAYNVSADKTGYGHEVKEVNVSEAPEDVEFKLNPGGGVTLKVVDGRDQRTLGANVRVTDAQGRDVGGDMPFRFSGGSNNEPIKLALAPGTYRVTVQAMSYAPRTLLVSSPSDQTVALTPGGSLLIHSKSSDPLRGRLIDANGFPYFASQFNPTGSFPILASPGTTTQQYVAPGHYRLDVLDKNDRVVKSIEIDVMEGRPAAYDV